MGRCHVFWVPFVSFSLSITCPRPSLLFWSLFPLLIFVWKDLFHHDGFFIQFGGGSRKSVHPAGGGSLSKGFCLFSHCFRTRRSRLPFQLPSSFSSHVFPSDCPFLAFPEEVPKIINLQFIQQACSCLSHICFSTLFVVDLHVISWHFVLTWPLSLSLSRKGVLWRSCACDTGFCAVVVVVVGVSGPDVDGD